MRIRFLKDVKKNKGTYVKGRVAIVPDDWAKKLIADEKAVKATGRTNAKKEAFKKEVENKLKEKNK